MTIIGLGLDLVEIERVRRLLERHRDRALERLLTTSEQAYCLSQALPARHVAVRLAAKEAAFKALQVGDGARLVGWRDSEVIRDRDGRPSLRFHGHAATTATDLGVRSAMVSLSHTDSHAAAVVILVG